MNRSIRHMVEIGQGVQRSADIAMQRSLVLFTEFVEGRRAETGLCAAIIHVRITRAPMTRTPMTRGPAR